MAIESSATALDVNRTAANAHSRIAFVTGWFIGKVRPGGNWDYKQVYGPGFRRFGNYNYGYVGTQLGYSAQVLHNAAGILQMTQSIWDEFAGNPVRWQPSYGLPFFGPPPFGDAPDDYRSIQRGIYDSVNNKLSICR